MHSPLDRISQALLGLGLLTAMATCAALADPQNMGKTDAGSFDAFLQELWPDAEARGVKRSTFELAFARLSPDPRVILATRRQPEYGKPVGAYIGSLASKGRIEAGIRQAKRRAPALAAVEKTFGVDGGIILGIWGIEASYGDYEEPWDVIRSLATLAQARYREPYFRNELLVALKICRMETFNGTKCSVRGRVPWVSRNSCPQATSIMQSTSLAVADQTSGPMCRMCLHQ